MFMSTVRTCGSVRIEVRPHGRLALYSATLTAAGHTVHVLDQVVPTAACECDDPAERIDVLAADALHTAFMREDDGVSDWIMSHTDLSEDLGEFIIARTSCAYWDAMRALSARGIHWAAPRARRCDHCAECAAHDAVEPSACPTV